MFSEKLLIEQLKEHREETAQEIFKVDREKMSIANVSRLQSLVDKKEYIDALLMLIDDGVFHPVDKMM